MRQPEIDYARHLFNWMWDQAATRAEDGLKVGSDKPVLATEEGIALAAG